MLEEVSVLSRGILAAYRATCGHRGHSTQSNGWDSGARGTHCRQGKLENRRTSQKERPEVSSELKVRGIWALGDF